MIHRHGFILRLQQRALRGYELLLYALLLSLALGVTFAVSPTAAEEVQCGNIQSSPHVIKR